MGIVAGESLAGEVLRPDVCIVGAGPAGVALAARLADTDLEVLVLDAGGNYLDRLERANALKAAAEHIRGPQADARGRNTGYPYYPVRLSRARGIGGSTAALKHHGLRSRPLDAIDFESGVWPIEHADYESYLSAATDICGIDALSFDKEDESAALDLAGDTSSKGVYFAHGARDAIAMRALGLSDLDRQTWVVNAAVTNLTVDATGTVSNLTATSVSGGSISVEAPAVVLATGGFDNARLILSHPEVLSLIGSGADEVGRNFMEHLHYTAGHILPSSEESFQAIYDHFCERDESRWITVNDRITKANGLARSAFVPIPAYQSSMKAGVRSFGRVVRSVPYGPFGADLWKQQAKDIWADRSTVLSATAGRLRGGSRHDAFVLGAMSEQRPHSESRMRLTSKEDRFGMRLPEVHWHIDDDDLASAKESAQMIGLSLEQAGLGEYVPIWSATTTPVFEGGWHHLGTTRMSTRFSPGVVDSSCRVIGTTNLYVAGSSVFPSGGFANPTLSIVALALRLGDLLANENAE
ncbi:MAG: GMC oxidoreductase [Acidimicrobiia bacterium]